MTQTQEAFLILVRLGLGLSADPLDVFDNQPNWGEIRALAAQQGLSAIVVDGINRLKEIDESKAQVSKEVMLPWIGEVLQGETVYRRQQKVAAEMAALFQKNGIRTYVLKGNVVAECYPKPEHRVSVDLDCFLCNENKIAFADGAEKAENAERSGIRNDEDVWEKGNRLIEEKGMVVKRDFYKNSTFFLPGLMVENHLFFTPFRGNKRLAALEKWLQSQLRDDSSEFRDSSKCLGSRIGDTCLYRPPVMVSALFLIEHAYSHFLHEGLTWRLVLDWMMFSKTHEQEIDWTELYRKIDAFHFRKFYDSYYRIGTCLLDDGQGVQGFKSLSLSYQDKRMLEDVWAPQDLHETVYGIKGKIALAQSTWRARWKYRYFTDISMLHALWIQVKGFLFDKNPEL